MGLFHVIFNIINPRYSTNWLSIKYNTWLSTRQKMENIQFRQNLSEPRIFFNVGGAGDICISESLNHKTANSYGFSFSVEWGRYGFIGGVIDKDEAKRMAEFILSNLNIDNRKPLEVLNNSSDPLGILEKLYRDENPSKVLYLKAVSEKPEDGKYHIEDKNHFYAWLVQKVMLANKSNLKNSPL